MRKNKKNQDGYTENAIVNNPKAETKEKLSRFDLFRAIIGISVIVTFAILWYTSNSLSEINDTFLSVTTLLLILYAIMAITEIVRLKKTKASLLNCTVTVALLVLIICVMLFRLDYMCEAMKTKPVETEFLRILDSTPSTETETIEAAKEAYRVGRVEPMKKVSLRFYVLSLITLAVTGIPTLIVYLIDKKKKAEVASQNNSEINENGQNLNGDNLEAEKHNASENENPSETNENGSDVYKQSPENEGNEESKN